MQARQHTLVAAPTGSGKTLVAFLLAIDELVCSPIAGQLEETTAVVYVSPLKALSNDIGRNLNAPLQSIHAALTDECITHTPIRVAVCTQLIKLASGKSTRRYPRR